MTINDSALTPEHGMCEEEQVARIPQMMAGLQIAA